MISLPPPHEYWKRPTEILMGDSDSKAIFQAVGQALTYWEMVEEAFAGLFAALIESPSIAAARAYGAIASAGGRRDVLREAATTFFLHYKIDQDSRDDFEIVMDHLARASGIRNEIAHGMVVHFKPIGSDNGVFLTAPLYNSLKTFVARNDAVPVEAVETDKNIFVHAKYKYTSEQINAFGGKFTILHQMAHGYRILHIHNFLEKKKVK